MAYRGLYSGVAGFIGTRAGTNVPAEAGWLSQRHRVSQSTGADTPLNVTLQSGVNVTGLDVSGNAVSILNQSGSPTNTLVVMENGATINVTNNDPKLNGTGCIYRSASSPVSPMHRLGAMPRSVLLPSHRVVQLLCKATASAKMR
jgi:hypothetical protein